MKPEVIRSSNGSVLTALSDSNRNEPDYLMWEVTPGHACGVLSNTAETRLFLDNVLRRFRQDASRRKARTLSKDLRTQGERDALAGKSIMAFYEIEPPKKRNGGKGRLTESMRAEYEIGYRAVKRQAEAARAQAAKAQP